MRVGPRGEERPALMDGGGTIRDLSGAVDDIAGEVLSDTGLSALAALDPASLPAVDPGVRIGPCVGRVGNIVAIGRNYAEHAAETGSDLPTEPMLFSKHTSSLCGPNDRLEVPRGSTKLDYEVELAIVIGARAKYVSEAQAMAHVAGFAVMNDVSERAFQKERQGQFVKGKSHDGFGPLGPWLVTRDAVDPSALRLWTKVNGETRQDGTTADMVFGVSALVSYISQFMTLMPGDVIPTGTPAGVAAGMTPPGWLAPGDVVECGIEGLGAQHQTVVAPA